MTTDDLLNQAATAIKDGRKAEARSLLAQVVQQDEHNETAWLWLSGLVETDEQRRTCLERVLALNPHNEVAGRHLEKLLAGEDAQPPTQASAPDAPRRKKIHRHSKMTRKQRIIVGILAGGVALVLITLAGIGLTMNVRWPQQEPTSPIAVALAITQLPSPLSPIATPQPTRTPPAPSASASVSISPPPSSEAVVNQYEGDIYPLAERLQAAQAPPPDLELPPAADWRVVLVPLSDRPYYVQTLLFPKWTAGEAGAPVTVYVAYTYGRGKSLRWTSAPAEEASGPVTPVTQEIIVTIRLVAEVDGELYLLEEREGMGGEGARSLPHMVQRAVRQSTALEGRKKEVEDSLETIVGYTAGMDWDTSLELPTRLAVLDWSLTSSYWADRAQAADTLIPLLNGIGPEAAETVPILVHLAEAEDLEVRGAAAEALARFGPRAVPALAQVLKDDEPLVRVSAAERLGRFGPQAVEAVPALAEALGDEEWQVREAAASALGRVGPEAVDAVPALAKALRDEVDDVRVAAADALGWIGPAAEEAVPALSRALKDESVDVRATAAWALRGMGPKATQAVPALTQALEDEEWQVREAAAGALGRVGPAALDAVPALTQALEDERLPVRTASLEALQAITGQDLGKDAAVWQAWWLAQR